MANWYCDYTNGNDTTGSGASGSPYKTVQKCVNVATGGDTIYIANTSAQVLAAAVTWNTGWTADDTKNTTFISWNNGGSLTIQRPDETSARVAAKIDGNSIASYLFSTTSMPEKIRLENIEFTGTTGGTGFINFNSKSWLLIGCKANSSGTTGTATIFTNAGYTSFINNYFISSTNSYYWFISSAWALNSMMSANYFQLDLLPNVASTSILLYSTQYGAPVFNNIFDCTNNTTSGGVVLRLNNNSGAVQGNTFIGNTSYATTAVKVENTGFSVYNNLFYKFNHASSVTISATGQTLTMLGYNAYFDSNVASSSISKNANLTAYDVTGSGDPFVNLAGYDFAVTGSTAANAGLGNP